MKDRKQDFALGLTFIIVMALFTGTILFLYPVFKSRGQRITINFRHQDGMAPLKPGSSVILGGSLDVGTVRNAYVTEVPDTTGTPTTVFVVECEIQRGLPLHGDCEITTDQPAIGGSGFVSILNVGTPGRPLVQPIWGRPPQSLAHAISEVSRRLLGEGGLLDHLETALDPEEENSVLGKILVSLKHINEITGELRSQMRPEDSQALLGKIHRVVEDLNATTAALRDQMSGGDDSALLAKVHVALDRLADALGEVTAMVREDRPLVYSTLTSVAHTARTVDEDLLGKLRTELDSGNAASLAGKLHAAMDQLNIALGDLRGVSSEIQRMVILNRPTLDRAMENVQAITDQGRLLLGELTLNPSMLIFPPGPARQRELVIFQAARSFAEAAGQLDLAANRLKAALQVLPPDGKASADQAAEIQSIHDGLRATFERFEQAQQTLWDKLK